MLLKNYYTSMEGMHGMHEMYGMHNCVKLVTSALSASNIDILYLPDPKCLPLVDLAPIEAQEIPGSAASSTRNITEGSAVQRKRCQKGTESKLSKEKCI